ncbi:DUF1365 family protein [Devosia riboflavina]
MRASSSAFTNAGSQGFSVAWLVSRNQCFSRSSVLFDTRAPRASRPVDTIKLLLAYPLMPVKLLMGIHWEALLLRLKGTPPRPRSTKKLGSLRSASRLLGAPAQ